MGTNVYINNPGHMTKMAAMPIYGKTLKNLLWKRWTGFNGIWHEASMTQVLQCTWGDRKVRIKMLLFLYLLSFRDEISSNNAAVYMQLFHYNNACIIRTRALQLSLWKHRLTLCGAT